MTIEFSPFLNSPEPATLYHYTSLEALVSIVKTKRLRATNIRFLNDTSEVKWLREHVVTILKTAESLQIEVDELEQIPQIIDFACPKSLFVSSFSERENDLSQWRAYCPSGLGVCVGFATACLTEQLIHNPVAPYDPFFLGTSLKKVNYYSPKHEKELRQVIARYLKAAARTSGSANEAIRKWQIAETIPAWLSLNDHYVKHFAFEGEAEWRKVITKDYRLMPGQQFRQGKSTLIPFIEFLLDRKTVDARPVAQEKYFIDKVTVGPTPNPELTIEAVKALLATEGHEEIPVLDCGIPYKDW